MVKFYSRFFVCFLFAFVLGSCQQETPTVSVREQLELQDTLAQKGLLQPGILTVLMSNNMASYYIYKGEPRGFEYDMIKLFCKENDLELKVKVVNEFDFLLDSLAVGKGDLAAGNLTITSARLAHVDFSDALLRTRQVLVQRLPENYYKLSRKQQKARMVSNALDLDGKTIYVTKGSAHAERLNNYARENGLQIDIQTVPENVGTDELVNRVAEGEIEFTIMDENVAKLHQTIHDNLDVSVPISLSQNIAWAIPKEKKALRKQVNEWLEKRRKSTRFNMIYQRYFSGRSKRKLQRSFLAYQEGRISEYDELLKKHATFIGWDWMLLAALVNKESKFNPRAHSSFGAVGLMQVLPTTAARFGIDSNLLSIPEPNIEAGTRFLQYLDQFWMKRIADTSQIIYFVLASYNAGPGHVLDAQYLCEKYGLDKNVWHGNVETMLRNKSQPKYYRDPVAKRGYCNGIQPVEYVKRVLATYGFYKQISLPEKQQEEIAIR